MTTAPEAAAQITVRSLRPNENNVSCVFDMRRREYVEPPQHVKTAAGVSFSG